VVIRAKKKFWVKNHQKSAKRNKKFFPPKSSIWVSKNAEFHSDFESVKKVLKNALK
jgi:hypothetical protein